MSRLSTRERLLAGVFCVVLFWGGWNYRHVLWDSEPTPRPAQPAFLAETAGPGAALGSLTIDTGSSPAIVAYEPPRWSEDPFNRPWR